MESFHRTHNYLLTHLYSPVRRKLMDRIDWNDRLIGIKGSRGVGKTTFLLSYARDYFGADNRECLYINLNQFIFTDRTLFDFAGEFRAQGGRTLLIDQVFKYPEWSEELRRCYDSYPDLRIVFTGSSVMRLRDENRELGGKVVPYQLRGFSFREYLNLTAGTEFEPYSFDEIRERHAEIAADICRTVKPLSYFNDYLHHGFYPFFLEKRNFSENLLKTMNMTLEVDVMYIRQIAQNYLPKLRKLFYLLSLEAPCTPNVSRLSKAIDTSRATVMNYIQYLYDARLLNLLYTEGEEASRKPSDVYLHNSNLMYAVNQQPVDRSDECATFFFNQLEGFCRLSRGKRRSDFIINNNYHFRIVPHAKVKQSAEFYYAVDKLEKGEGNLIPLWLWGFLY